MGIKICCDITRGKSSTLYIAKTRKRRSEKSYHKKKQEHEGNSGHDKQKYAGKLLRKPNSKAKSKKTGCYLNKNITQ